MELPLELGLVEQPPSDPPQKKLQYVSCIRIHGRPILPPLLTEEARQEMAKLRRAAVELENLGRPRRTSCSSGFGRVLAEQQSTPSRPATLDLKARSRAKRMNETLEHRLARKNIDSDDESERKYWSPLETDTVSGIKLKVGTESDSTQDTPETVTASPHLIHQTSPHLIRQNSPHPIRQNSPHLIRQNSPHLIRQNSYTLLSPSPALLDLLETQERAQSGRKTWDLRQARRRWANDARSDSDDSGRAVDESFRSQGGSVCSTPKRYRVPSSVPSYRREPPTVPCDLEEKISKLSIMMTSLKMRHDQQRRELEDRQRHEQQQFEVIIKEKMAALLTTTTKTVPRSSSSCRVEVTPHADEGVCLSEPAVNVEKVRPFSAREQMSRRAFGGSAVNRARSAERCDDNMGQETDIDVSFQEDYTPGKPGRKHNYDWYESQSISSRSRSSTMSLDAVPTNQRNGCHLKPKFMYHGDPAVYHKAAAKICAGAKGFLTRRLMRTEYVYSLYRSLRDTNNLVKTLKGTDDLGTGDLDFMAGLTRQIHSNWHAIYEVFLEKEPEEQMKIIAADRGRILSARNKASAVEPGKKVSSATMKSISRRQTGMSTSLTTLPRSGSFTRSCFKMSSSLSGALPPRRPSYK